MGKAPYRRHSLTDKTLWILALICLGVFLMYMIFSGRGICYFYKLGQKKENLRNLNENLTRDNKDLKEKIGRIKNDKVYQEEVARKDLGFVRENETIYMFEEKTKKGEGKR